MESIINKKPTNLNLHERLDDRGHAGKQSRRLPASLVLIKSDCQVFCLELSTKEDTDSVGRVVIRSRWERYGCSRPAQQRSMGVTPPPKKRGGGNETRGN